MASSASTRSLSGRSARRFSTCRRSRSESMSGGIVTGGPTRRDDAGPYTLTLMKPARLVRGSLPSMSVALGSEEGRAFLQDRLALFAKACCLIALSFYALANLIAAPLPGHGGLFCFTHPANRLMLANCALLLAVWLACRRGVFSQPALSTIDAA